MTLNRYIFEGIVSDLEGGAEIGVFAPNYKSAVSIMYDIMKYTDERYTYLRLSAGEILHASGGRASIFFQDTQALGYRFDIVLVPYGSGIGVRLGQEVEVIEY